MIAQAVLATRVKLLRGGYSPIPCEGKRPVLKAWEKHVATNSDEITLWSKVYERAENTGVLTRRTPTLDADILNEDAARAVEDLVREHFEERGYVLTRIGRAPKRAFLFRTEEPFKKIAIDFVTHNGGAAEKLEFLGDGQQVIVAGTHPDTLKPYRWFGGEPGEIAHESLPYIREAEARELIERAADLLVAEHGYVRADERPRQKRGNADEETARHRAKARKDDAPELVDRAKIEAAIAVIDSGPYETWLHVGAALRYELGKSGFNMFDAWSARSPKYQPDECKKKWRDVLDLTEFTAGTIFYLADQTDPGWRDRYDSARQDQAKAEEPPAFDAEPVDLWGNFEPPTLPRGLLPELIENYTRVQAETMGVDPGGIAMAALAVCAAAIPDRIQLVMKQHTQDWTESARLWVALVGMPSTKKSPIMTTTIKPLATLDFELLRKFRVELRIYEEMEKDERKKASKPVQKRLRLEDTTIEGAQEVLAESPNGVLLVQDELSGFFGSMDKYSGHRGAAKDRGFWLQSWNGGQYALNRINRGAGIIPNLSVSLLGGIQPDLIRRLSAESHDDGFLQRMLLVVMRPAEAGRDVPTPEVSKDYAQLVEQLTRLKYPVSSRDDDGVLRFDSNAQDLRGKLEIKHLVIQSGVEAINRKLAAHIGKYDGYFGRLCIVWQCIENAYGSRRIKDVDDHSNVSSYLPATVTLDTATRVAEFMRRFLLPHAYAFYGGILGLADDHDRLAAVAGYILAHEKQRLTNRDVQRGCRSMRKLERRDTEAVFEQLEALGWVTRTAGPRLTDPAHWIVNPAVHRKFAERAKTEAVRRQRERAIIIGMIQGRE